MHAPPYLTSAPSKRNQVVFLGSSRPKSQPVGQTPWKTTLNSCIRSSSVMRAHSDAPRTSSRHVATEVVPTYIAVVPPDSVPPPSWRIVDVAQTDLARGDATAPPSSIDISQVLEHALPHPARLTQDDPVIAGLLDDWSHALSDYIAEPFRAPGGPGPGGQESGWN